MSALRMSCDCSAAVFSLLPVHSPSTSHFLVWLRGCFGAAALRGHPPFCCSCAVITSEFEWKRSYYSHIGCSARGHKRCHVGDKPSAFMRLGRRLFCVARQSGPAAFVKPGKLSTGKLLAYYADHNVVPLPDGHRFPMDKYAATRQQLVNDLSLQHCLELQPGPAANVHDLTTVHDAHYIERFRTGQLTESDMRAVGFPWSQELVARTFSSAGGTVAAVRALFEEGRSVTANIAGGTHHAFADRGEGFCVFNDLAVAAAVAMRDYGVQRVLVVDLDVHQGNGTAGIFEHDSRVVTFDMHGDKNYPWKTRMRNTYDVALPDGTGDEVYLATLGSWLPRLLDHDPQLLLFQAGVDALQGDSFGRLCLSRAGLNTRNNMMLSFALQNSIPMAIAMGGGYTRPMDSSVAAHTDVYRTAAYRLHAAWRHLRNGDSMAMQEAVV